jgi:hypothetical protein
MTLTLAAIDVVDTIDRAAFARDYVDKNKPLIIKKLAPHWPAWTRWTSSYFAERFGDRRVMVNSKDVAATGFYGHHGGIQEMAMRDFLRATLDEERDLRFAARHTTNLVPDLKDDFDYVDLGKGYAPRMTWLFFGCTGSRTPLHYDFDCFHVFHACFSGRKTFYLFDQDQNRALHQQWPTARSPVDPGKPDYAAYPRLHDAKGYVATLDAGDTLYIPAAMWHDVRYHAPSISLTIRFTEKKPMIVGRVMLSLLLGAINDRLESWAPMRWPQARKRLLER